MHNLVPTYFPSCFLSSQMCSPLLSSSLLYNLSIALLWLLCKCQAPTRFRDRLFPLSKVLTPLLILTPLLLLAKVLLAQGTFAWSLKTGVGFLLLCCQSTSLFVVVIFFFSKYCLMKLLLLKCNECVNCLKAVSIHRYILCLSAGACLPGWPAHLQYWVQCLVQRKHLINRCWMNEWVAGQPFPFWLNNHSSLQSILSVPCPLVSPLLVLGDSTRVTVWMPF